MRIIYDAIICRPRVIVGVTQTESQREKKWKKIVITVPSRHVDLSNNFGRQSTKQVIERRQENVHAEIRHDLLDCVFNAPHRR